MTPAKIVSDEDRYSSDSDSSMKFDFTAYSSMVKRQPDQNKGALGHGKQDDKLCRTLDSMISHAVAQSGRMRL